MSMTHRIPHGSAPDDVKSVAQTLKIREPIIKDLIWSVCEVERGGVVSQGSCAHTLISRDLNPKLVLIVVKTNNVILLYMLQTLDHISESNLGKKTCITTN